MARRAWERPGLGVGGYFLLAALAGLSPLTSVFILPALPELVTDLHTTLSAAQFALSMGFTGLAAGLLIVGPLSDRLGRTAPLWVGLVLYILTTLLCAIAPGIGTLVLFRLAQGMAGGAVWVISRAVVRDIYPARASARVFSQMAMITGLAPVIAPVIAGQLLAFTDWRGLFVALASFGAVVMVLALVFMRETLPPERRHQGGAGSQLRSMAGLFREGYFLTFLLLGVVQSAMHFTFVIMSPFVFDSAFGLDAQGFALLYAGATLTMVLGNQINALLLRRWMPDTLLRIQLAIAVVGSAAFLVTILVDAPLPVVITALLLAPFSAGASNANITALALAPYGHAAGTAAALLGACQFGIGALVPPLVSLLGAGGAAMGAAMLVTATGALVIALFARSRLRETIARALRGSGDDLLDRDALGVGN